MSALMAACPLGRPWFLVRKPALVIQDHAQEAAVNRQRAASRVIDKAQRPELVHEVADPGSGGSDHLRQMFLIYPRKDGFGFSFLAITRKQEENPGEALLTGVEELIDQILLIPHVADQEMRHKQFRDVVLFVEHSHHQWFFNPVKGAVGKRGSRSHAQRPSGKASFAEKLTGTYHRDNCFLALLGLSLIHI